MSVVRHANHQLAFMIRYHLKIQLTFNLCSDSMVRIWGSMKSFRVEILSPSTSEKDLTHKYELYRSYGVLEYWVVAPTEKTLTIYHLNASGEYRPSQLYTRGNIVFSTMLEGFSLDLAEVFEPFDWKALEEEEKSYQRI